VRKAKIIECLQGVSIDMPISISNLFSTESDAGSMRARSSAGSDSSAAGLLRAGMFMDSLASTNVSSGSSSNSESVAGLNNLFADGKETPYSLAKDYDESKHGDNGPVKLAKKLYDVLREHKVLGKDAEIKDHQHAAELMQKLRGKLSGKPETFAKVLKSLENPYDLNFGDKDLDKLNAMRKDANLFEKPDDYAIGRSAFIGDSIASKTDVKNPKASSTGNNLGFGTAMLPEFNMEGKKEDSESISIFSRIRGDLDKFRA